MNDLKYMNEKQSIRLLRRVDWRYLLSNPQPKKTICFDDGLLRQAVGSVSFLVGTDQAKSGECNLAVAVHPTHAELRSAWEVLCSTGEIYTEWYAPWTGGMKGVCRRLQKAGFTDVKCYLPWPPPILASPLYWFPIESPKILLYHLNNRPTSASIVVRISRLVLRLLINLGWYSYLLMPICAVARKSTVDTEEGFNQQINTEIVSRWQHSRLDELPSRIDWLLWTPGHKLISKIIAIVFSEHQEKPVLVVKIPRSSSAAQALNSEACNLTILLNRKDALPAGVPVPVFTLDWKGITTVGIEFAEGVPIYDDLNQSNYRNRALKVTDWLIKLANGSITSPHIESRDQKVDSVMADFVQSFGLVFTQPEVNCIHTIMSNLDTLPIVFEQRDCSPWNIIMNRGGEITVLDWESSEPRGWPGLDLIYFLTHLSFFLQGAMASGRYLDAYRNACDPKTSIGKVNKECQEKYWTQINMDRAVLQPLRLLTWLIHSRHEYQRLMEDAVGAPTADALRAGLFSQLVREEIRLYMGACPSV